MITLIHGPAELLRAEALDKIRTGIADDPVLVTLNTTILDGRKAEMADLQFACEALPFPGAIGGDESAQRRLVVVEGLLRRLAGPGLVQAKGDDQVEATGSSAAGEAPSAGKTLEKALLAYLDRVPETTELVFVEEELLTGGALMRRLLELQRAGRGRVVVCANPKRNDLPGWIRARGQKYRLKLDAAAVADLAEFVGDDLRQLDQELLKLRDYAPDGRPITRGDVRRLVPATRAANVFDLVEALGAGDGATAGRLMRHALDADGEQPLRLLALIARQYRLLIQAKALQAQGLKPPEIAQELRVPEWTAPKLLAQAGRHSFVQLEQAMERLAAADEAIKTGRLTDREAMDVLLVELVTPPWGIPDKV